MPKSLRATVICFLTLFASRTFAGLNRTCKSPSSFPPSAAEIDLFTSRSFDFIIIGGGTAGLALATRLAEDDNLTIGVLEAGMFHLNDPIVDVPQSFQLGQNNPNYDWGFVYEVNDGGAAPRNLSVPRGKMLGGSSGLNGMGYNRASREEYDSWLAFDSTNHTWNWDNLLPCFKKSETYALVPGNPYPGITPEQARETLEELPYISGFKGPVQASHSLWYPGVLPNIVKAFNSLGLPTNPKPQGGSNLGVSNTLQSIDAKTGTRSYAAVTYYCTKGASQSNLHILLGAQVTKINFLNNRGGQGDVNVASGVNFMIQSKSYTVNTTREVVLSAGTVQTPQVLELSGIGNSSRLSEFEIPVIVDLPSVGENLQEHVFPGIQWQLKPGHQTYDVLRNNLTFAAEQQAIYNATGTGPYASWDTTTAFLRLQDIVGPDRLQQLLTIFDREAQNPKPATLEGIQNRIRRSWITEGKVAISEVAASARGWVNPVQGESYMFILAGLEHPMSHGSVHITSPDPLAHPRVDLGFLQKEFDLEVLLDIFKWGLKLGDQRSFSPIIASRVLPDPSVDSDDKLREYLRSTSGAGSHPVGTAAMGRREDGGVVDGTLKVYGTANLRVVDASIIPIQIAAQTQTTVYALAERAAEFIKASM